MTREEAKDVFLNRGFIEAENCHGRIFHGDKWREACVVISEWLKEEPRWISILEKIRAEIIENSIEDYNYHGCGTDELIIETSEVLRVLDKYKAESEGQKDERKADEEVSEKADRQTSIR